LEAVGQAGALVNDGTAVKDQLLHRTGLAVLGSPGFEFGVMSQEQVGQVVGIGGVVLGAAGDKGFAILLQRDGVDGVELNPFIGFQEGDEVDGGLFQADRNPGLGMVLAELEQPLPKGFGSGVDDLGTALAGGGVEEVQVGFAIGTIQADDQVIGMGSIHAIAG
jgi:hypothetical protein